MTIRIGLITTVNFNIGDDLIREGLRRVLEEDVFAGQSVEFVVVNKHRPFTVYPGWHPTRWLPRGKRMANLLTYQLGLSLFDCCDLIVQCGAPVLWPKCHTCHWAIPLWHRVVGRLSRRVPVLNLAAGSCYPWERQPANISNPREAEFLKTILGYCRITTVRDRLAQHLCEGLGVQTKLIPCSALLTSGTDIPRDDREPSILINYMHGAGHWDWNQRTDPEVWGQTVQVLIQRLRTCHSLQFLCHNEAEYNQALELDPTLPRIWPKSPQEYHTAVSHARVALCNRMHASIALAGQGIPSVAVGTDSRLLMVEAIGLPYFYVKEVNTDRLETELEELLTRHPQENDRLLMLRDETRERYGRAIRESLARGF